MSELQMMMNCVKCGAPLDLSRPTCPRCRVAVDSDGDGLPDALGALIEQKARAIVAQEKEREAEEAKRREAEEARQVADAEARAKVEEARAGLITSVAEIARIESGRVEHWKGLVVLVLVLAALGGVAVGAVFTCAVEPLLGGSLLSGNMLCTRVACVVVTELDVLPRSSTAPRRRHATDLGTLDTRIDALSRDMVIHEQETLTHAPFALSGWWNLGLNSGASFGLLLLPTAFGIARLRRTYRRGLLANVRAQKARYEKTLADADQSGQGVPYR